MWGTESTRHIRHTAAFPSFNAHRCSFDPGRVDPYLRLGTVNVFVRDQERSLRFFLEQLGFGLAFDNQLPSGERWLAVSPPDGTAVLTLVAPKPDSDDFARIGRSAQITFLTENVSAKFDEWRLRGVLFPQPPRMEDWGAISAVLEDPDGNSFTLLSYEDMILEIESQRRTHTERIEAEGRAAREREFARAVQARLLPQAPPCLNTLDCAAICVQAREVGGDYYDFLDLGREHMGLVIGDISGKGTAAALLMANLQAHLRSQCPAYWSRPYTPFALGQPERLLRSVNQLFYQNTAEGATPPCSSPNTMTAPSSCVMPIAVTCLDSCSRMTASSTGWSPPAQFSDSFANGIARWVNVVSAPATRLRYSPTV